MDDVRRCEKTGVVIGYSGPKLGTGSCCPAHHYFAAVSDGLSKAGLWISAEWMEGQYNRVMLHRDMGLTIPQSIEELRPFAEAQKHPRVQSPRELIASLRELGCKIETRRGPSNG